MIQVQCNGCGKRYQVPDPFAGKKMRCKQCSAVIAIPSPAVPSAPEEEPPRAEEPPPLKQQPPADTPAEAAEAPSPRAKAFKFQSKKKFPSKAGAAGAGIPKRGFAPKKFGKAKPAPAKREAPPEGEDGEEAARPSSQKKVILLIGGCVLLVALVILAYVYFSGSKTPTPKPKRTAETTKIETTEKDTTTTEASEEKTEATPEEPVAELKPVDPLGIIPAETKAIGKISFGRLANIEGIKEVLEAMLKSEDAAKIFSATEFDPMAHLSTVWIAGAPTTGEETSEDALVVILEGIFNKEKVIAGLKGESLISSKPVKLGPFEVFKVLQGEQEKGYMTFVSDGQLLFGDEIFFNKAIKLVEGGESVRDNRTLQDLSSDFKANSVIWVAAEVPTPTEKVEAVEPEAEEKAEAKTQEAEAKTEEEAEVEEKVEKQPEKKPEKKTDKKAAGKASSKKASPPGAEMPVGKFFLSGNPGRGGSGLKIEIEVYPKSAKDMVAMQMVVPGLLMMAKSMATKEAQPVLESLKIAPEKDLIRLSAEIPADMLKKAAVSMLSKVPGMPQIESEEGGEEGEGEEEGTEEESAAGDEKPAEKEEPAETTEPPADASEESKEES